MGSLFVAAAAGAPEVAPAAGEGHRQRRYPNANTDTPNAVPTPDPYTWIENLPLSGDTPTYSTTWCQLVENPPSCPQYLLYWHGRSFDSFGLIDAGTYTMDVGQVGFAFYVLCCPPWQWDATSMATTLYNQHSAAGTYTYDITCPTLSPPPPPNMEGGAYCRNVQPAQHLVGANAVMNIQLRTSDLSARNILGGSLTFPHKLYP